MKFSNDELNFILNLYKEGNYRVLEVKVTNLLKNFPDNPFYGKY